MERRALRSEIRNEEVFDAAAELPALDHGVDPGHGRDEVVRVGLAGLGHGAGLGGEVGNDRASQERQQQSQEIQHLQPALSDGGDTSVSAISVSGYKVANIQCEQCNATVIKKNKIAFRSVFTA